MQQKQKAAANKQNETQCLDTSKIIHTINEEPEEQVAAPLLITENDNLILQANMQFAETAFTKNMQLASSISQKIQKTVKGQTQDEIDKD